MTNESAAGAGKTLNVGLISPVQSLNPLQAQDFVSSMVVCQVFDTPYATPMKDEAAKPLLFSDPLAVGTNELVMSARVRPGIRFSDGTPLTADHIASSLERATPLKEHAEVEAEGDRVVFHLKRPNARFDLVLTQTFTGVTLEKDGELLGTGPYLPAPDATPEVMRLIRNPHNTTSTQIEEIVFKCYPPDADGRPRALVSALENGEMHFSNVLHRDDVKQLKNVRKFFELGNSTALLYFNTQRAALRDVRVRQAIAQTIDRLELTRKSHLHALAHTAKSILPSIMSSWRDNIKFDLVRAKALIDEAGADAPARLSLLVIFGPRPYLPHPLPSAEYIATQLAKIGIEVEIQPTRDSKHYYETVAAGDYDMVLSGWLADTVDPTDFLEALLNSESIPSPDRPISVHANLGRWQDAATDEALAKLRREPTEANQHEVLRLAAEEVPVLPLINGSIAFVHSWNVRNFEPPVLGIPYFSQLELQNSLI
jgi:ABC-type transport system substrate-binding protein